MRKKLILKKNPVEKIIYDFIKNSQRNHWWFVGRKKIVDQILHLYYPKRIQEAIDIGSGYGAMLPLLLQYCKNVDALEPLLETKPDLIKLGAREVFSISSFPNHSVKGQYELVTLFDVLEHIADQEKALRIIREQMLKPGGRIILTVPAYQWLWTSHDTVNHHYRRYSKKQLLGLLKANGYKKIKATYFMTVLFPLAVLQRLLMKWSRTTEEFRPINPVINFILKVVFSSEALWICHFPYPFGLSVLAVAEI